MKPRQMLISYDPATGDIQMQNDFDTPIVLVGVLETVKTMIVAEMLRPKEGRVVVPRMQMPPPGNGAQGG